MYCPNCGRELPHNDFARCPFCGAPLSASAVDNAPTVGSQGQIAGQLPENYTGGSAPTVLSRYGQAPAAPSGQPTPYAPNTPNIPNAPGYVSPASRPLGGYPYPPSAPNPANPANQPSQPYAPANSGAAQPSTPTTPPLTPPSYAQGYGQGYAQAPTRVSAPTGPGYGPPGYAGYPPTSPSPQGPQGRQFSLPVIILSCAILVAILVALIVGVIKLTTQGGGTTSQTHNQATATVPAATATPSATVLFQDPLTSNAKGWFDDGSHCFFKSDGYHIQLSQFCTAPMNTPGANITVSVNVKEASGGGDLPFGIVLRRSGKNYYSFEVNSQGEWVFLKGVASTNTYTKLHDYTTNAAIHKGLNTTNTLKVVIRGSAFACYVNNTLVGQVTDASYSSGQVGLISEKYEAVFTTMLVTEP